MDGRQHGLGFLFLYSLLQGDIRVRAARVGYFSVGRSTDAHRLAQLLTQLFSNRTEKSLPNSIINILNRNRGACIRMPRFHDTRKNSQNPVHNGWQDASESQSVLPGFFSTLVSLFHRMKRGRGMLRFPPPPPYPELPPHPTKCMMTVTQASAGKKQTDGVVSNYNCDSRILHPVSAKVYQKLFTIWKYDGSRSTNSNVWRLLKSATGKHQVVPHPVEPVDTRNGLFEKLKTISDAGLGGPSGSPALIVVLVFHAQWCPACKALAPALRILSSRLPTVRLISIDADDSDGLTSIFKIAKFPTLIGLRPTKPVDPDASEEKVALNMIKPLFRLTGGGPGAVTTLARIIVQSSTPDERDVLAQSLNIDSFLDGTETTDTVIADVGAKAKSKKEKRSKFLSVTSLQSAMAQIDVSESECSAFATDTTTLQFLAEKQFSGHPRILSAVQLHDREAEGLAQPISELPFDVSAHPNARSGVARQMVARIRKDIAYFSTKLNTGCVARLAHLDFSTLEAFFRSDAADESGTGGAEQIFKAARKKCCFKARATVTKLLKALRDLKAEDTRVVEATPPLLEAAANYVDLSDESGSNLDQRLRYHLRRIAGQEPRVFMQLIYRALLSDCGVEDLMRVNPFVSESMWQQLLQVAVACIFRASRLGCINRSVPEWSLGMAIY